MRVAFHIQNDNFADVDFSNVINGNPGVGGSDNSHVLIPTYLQRRGDINCVLLSNKKGVYDPCLENVVINNVEGALSYCECNNDINLIVFNANCVDADLIKRHPRVKVILWSHNFNRIRVLRKYEKIANIVRIVNVGKEYNDLYRDMLIFNKSIYIFNAFNLERISLYYNNLPSFESRPYHVVYIGSIIKAKGFHLLAKSWSKIKKEVPEAELFVVGSGRLYNKNAKLGEWGIAEEEYERSFIPYIKEGLSIRNDIHFLGILGPEKYEVFKHCRVGVANPSGESETFGNGAVEMQLMGCNVTTIKCAGYLDSVYNKENLYDNPSQLADYVIKLLKKETNPHNEILAYIKENFSLDKIAHQWSTLLKSDLSMPVFHEKLSTNETNYHNKYLKEWIRLNIPAFIRRYNIPIEWYYPSPIIKIKKSIAEYFE